MSPIKLIWSCVCVGVCVCFRRSPCKSKSNQLCEWIPHDLKMRSDSVFFLIYMFLNEYDFVVVSTRASVLMKIPIVRHSSCMLTAGLVVAVGNAVLGRILKMPRVRWEAVPSSLRKRVDQEWVKGSRCTEPLCQPGCRLHPSSASALPGTLVLHHLWRTSHRSHPRCRNYNTIFLLKLIWIQVQFFYPRLKGSNLLSILRAVDIIHEIDALPLIYDRRHVSVPPFTENRGSFFIPKINGEQILKCSVQTMHN